jgi:predicted DCC family thiol-disulfide oxidoreductase YuxK
VKTQDSRTTFLFDGDCAFCSACARFIERWIPTEARVVPWQRADLAALGLTRTDCDAAVQWVEPGRTLAGPAAIAALLRSSRGMWRLIGWVLARRSMVALGWPVYRLVSRNRHRLPGGTAVCSLPADQRAREGHQ